MKFYGQAESVAMRVLEAFRTGQIPKALSQVFIHRTDLNIPCRTWSVQNQIIVALMGTSDARGFRQWAEVERHVRAGEKAFHILVPCFRKVAETKPDGTENEDMILYGFRGVPVFALEQTEGKALPVDRENKTFLESLPLREVAESWGLSVDTYNGQETGALGWYRHGQAIALGVKNLSTWAHELCHASDDRLGSLEKSSREEREIVAELSGCALLECLGYHTESDTGGAWEYIMSWAVGDRNKALRQCLRLIERSANVVSNILETAETMREAA